MYSASRFFTQGRYNTVGGKRFWRFPLYAVKQIRGHANRDHFWGVVFTVTWNLAVFKACLYISEKQGVYPVWIYALFFGEIIFFYFYQGHICACCSLEGRASTLSLTVQELLKDTLPDP